MLGRAGDRQILREHEPSAEIMRVERTNMGRNANVVFKVSSKLTVEGAEGCNCRRHMALEAGIWKFSQATRRLVNQEPASYATVLKTHGLHDLPLLKAVVPAVPDHLGNVFAKQGLVP